MWYFIYLDFEFYFIVNFIIILLFYLSGVGVVLGTELTTICLLDLEYYLDHSENSRTNARPKVSFRERTQLSGFLLVSSGLYRLHLVPDELTLKNQSA